MPETVANAGGNDLTGPNIKTFEEAQLSPKKNNIAIQILRKAKMLNLMAQEFKTRVINILNHTREHISNI